MRERDENLKLMIVSEKIETKIKLSERKWQEIKT
jgi:hypothetical protein